MMTMNDASALSATTAMRLRFSGAAFSGCSTSCRLMSFGNFHTSRNASPMFLFAEPPRCSDTSCEFEDSKFWKTRKSHFRFQGLETGGEE
jgi:hypothetical protein